MRERGDDAAGAVFVSDQRRSIGRRSTVTCFTPTIASAIWCARTSIARRCSTGRFAASGRDTVRRSRTRSSASPTRSGIRFFSSPRASTRARSTSTDSRCRCRATCRRDLVHALPGLEDAVMLRPGYAVEYDFMQPTELTRRLETKRDRAACSSPARSTARRATRRPRRRGSSPASTRRSARIGRDGVRAAARRGVHRHPR